MFLLSFCWIPTSTLCFIFNMTLHQSFQRYLALLLTAVPFNVVTGHSQSFSGTTVFIMIKIHHSDKMHFCNLQSSQLTSQFRSELLGKLVAAQSDQIFPRFYGTFCPQQPHLSPLSQMNPIHTHSFYFVQTQFNMHMSFKWLLSSSFLTKILCTLHFPHIPHVLLSHPP